MKKTLYRFGIPLLLLSSCALETDFVDDHELADGSDFTMLDKELEAKSKVMATFEETVVVTGPLEAYFFAQEKSNFINLSSPIFEPCNLSRCEGLNIETMLICNQNNVCTDEPQLHDSNHAMGRIEVPDGETYTYRVKFEAQEGTYKMVYARKNEFSFF